MRELTEDTVITALRRTWQPVANTTDLPADQALSLARKLPLGSVGTGVVPLDARPELLLKLRDYIHQQTL